MRDAVNKVARLVVNHCIKHRIGTIVFGWNTGQKQNVNLGNKTNQKFVQIPTARLKERIRQLCGFHGLQFVEQGESYSSQASFLDGDSVPTYGAKPDDWIPSGKRVYRSLCRTATGYLVNADANGAANILTKARKSPIIRCRAESWRGGQAVFGLGMNSAPRLFIF
ncbi:MAG: IS200/IS605 family element transposase accessory protein TnpB [Prochloron sp. SP5CPC1]|nr:IS200/IS605 family element transposase accessory protein TnpB [Candidatus Paraprochloron terpiosi SP5CPC1]